MSGPTRKFAHIRVEKRDGETRAVFIAVKEMPVFGRGDNVRCDVCLFCAFMRSL